MLDLVLYGRPSCHLCDEMADELRDFMAGRPYRLRVENVDSREDWKSRYGTRVPVLATGDGRELCHYHFDKAGLVPLTK
jgi:hypothetical protein